MSQAITAIAPPRATGFKGWIQRTALSVAKMAGYNAATPTSTTRAGSLIGTNSNSTWASIQRVAMNFTAEMVAKNSAIAAAYLATRVNYCSSQITYIPNTGDTALDEEIKAFLQGEDGLGGVFATMGVDCSMQDAFTRTADIELPVRGDAGLIRITDSYGDPRLVEFSADQLGEIYNYQPPRACSIAERPNGEIVEVPGNDCIYFAGRYMCGPDAVAYKIYQRTDAYYGNPRVYRAADVIYLRDPASFRGLRGVTRFANALEHMQKGEDMLQAALSSAQRQARTAMAVFNNTGGPQEYSYESTTYDDGTVKYYSKQPGYPNVEYFFNGDEARFESTTAPGEEVIRGVETADERVAIALGVNYAFLISATKVGGAPSRLEVERASKEWKRIKNTIHKPALNRIKDITLQDAFARGLLDKPASMPMARFLRGSWQLPVDATVDAGYAAKENRDNLRYGIESVQKIAAEMNLDWRLVYRQNGDAALQAAIEAHRVNKILEEMGIPARISTNEIAQRSENPQQMAQAEQLETGAATPTQPGAKPTGGATPNPSNPSQPQPAQADVPMEALNGAQVTALADLASQVAAGTLPIETAINLAKAAFPDIPEATMNKIFGPLRTFEPKKEEPAPAEPPVSQP